MHISRIGLGACAALALMQMESLASFHSGTHTTAAEKVVTATRVGHDSQPAQRNNAPASNSLAAFFGGGGYNTRRSQRRAGFGWTNGHAKRVARKARNVKRHRSALKG